MPDFYPHQPAGVDGAKANLHNCVDIFHKYCSQVLRQSLNMDELYIYETQEIRALGPEQREVLCAVRFPTPDGYVTVHLDEVNAHWGEVTEEQVAGTQFASKTRADFERRRFLYTVIVRMSQLECLDASLGPSAGALAGTRSAVDAQKLADQLVLGDSFAPDSGEAPVPATRPVPAPSSSVPASPLVSEASPSKVESVEAARRKQARQEAHQARQAQAQEEAAQRKRARQEAHQAWQGKEQAQADRRKREQQQMPPNMSPMPPMPPMPPARWRQSLSPPQQQQQEAPQAPSQAPPQPQQQAPPQAPSPLASPLALPPAPLPLPLQPRTASVNSDPKSQLSKKVMLRWRTAGTDSSVLRYDSQMLPSGGYVATVTLGRCNSGAG